MVGGDIHPLTEVEPMGCIPLNAGVKINRMAAELSSSFREGLEECGPVSVGTLDRDGGEIIDVELPYRTGIGHNAPTGYGNTALILKESGEA